MSADYHTAIVDEAVVDESTTYDDANTILIAKYKFDHNVYADLIPEFNEEFTSNIYTISDEVAEDDSYTIRTIESDDLPTLMRFGSNLDTYVEGQEVALLEILEMNTSALTSCYRMFRYCTNLISIECEWNTNNVTDVSSMFTRCKSLTSLDVSNFNTSNVTNMIYMFSNCNNLTSLDVSNFNTSNVTNMSYMFYGCNKLTSLDVSNFNTSKVTDMDYMFYNCNNLTSLDVSNFNTSNVANMYAMFWNCNNLTTLDVSNFNTSNVANMNYMFDHCTSLTTLDISNFTTLTLNSDKCFHYACTKLSDVGMIYCDEDIINSYASLHTNIPRTIWVGEDIDISSLDQYDHITYRYQKVSDTVHLNSPLLMGDTVEVIDGKTYHVHRYEKVVLDGSENWVSTTKLNNYTRCVLHNFAKTKLSEFEIHTVNNILPDTSFGTLYNRDLEGVAIAQTGNLSLKLVDDRFGDTTNFGSVEFYNAFITWLKANPVIVIYPKETPYYELISDEPLELSLLSTTDNTINNNSILPSNMEIVNKELSTIAIKSSTAYTLAFDKSTDEAVSIDVCGSEVITTYDTLVEIITPETISGGIEFISTNGCVISNVRLLEGSLVEEAMPNESFEGLQSSFDEGYIIGENLLPNTVDSVYVNSTKEWIQQDLKYPVSELTIVLPDTDKYVYYTVYDSDGNWVTNVSLTSKVTYVNLSNQTVQKILVTRTDLNNFLTDDNSKMFESNEEFANYGIVVLEGDHTHLSEAELLRYIEKGTDHYTEEDWNHVGKYKVEVKSTGKNKLNINLPFEFDYTEIVLDKPIAAGKYTLSSVLEGYDDGDSAVILFRNGNERATKELQYPLKGYTTTFLKNCDNIRLYSKNGIYTNSIGNMVTVSNFQLEEGTVATDYEPYKEEVHTYYLDTPFLEGDTIEDIDGVATHVKRYGKVVWDGSENWYNHQNNDNFISFLHYGDSDKNFSIRTTVCDRFKVISWDGQLYNNSFWYHGQNSYGIILSKSILSTQDTNGFKQWLSENPTTVVYELAEPIYEPISTDSILIDSYVNGHLDISSDNIPIEKTEFNYFTKELIYLQPSTDYIVRFSSDNIGIAKIYLDSSVKEINVVKGINDVIITTPSTIVNNNIIIDGIGFNASNVQVMADVIKDGDIKDYDYFKGLQSSFEDGLVTDETDENYGKYKVEFRVSNEENESIHTLYLNSPLLKGDKIIVHDSKLQHYHVMGMRTYEEGDKDLYITDLVNTVYELEEPYYETIEPQLSSNSFSTVKDGDMEIITALPIELDLMYRTDIASVPSIEEQIANIQENAIDVSSLIDEEVDSDE